MLKIPGLLNHFSRPVKNVCIPKVNEKLGKIIVGVKLKNLENTNDYRSVGCICVGLRI